MAWMRTDFTRRERRILWCAAASAEVILLIGAGAAASASQPPSYATAQTALAVADTPVPSPSPSPSDEPAPTPTPTPTPTAATPPPDVEPTASPDPTPAPSATATPDQTATPQPTPTPTPATVPAIPPAVAGSTATLPTLLIALGVLLAAAVMLWLLLRRERAQGTAEAGDRVVGTDPPPVALDAMASLGTAMIDSGYPVGLVRSALDDMAKVSGLTAAGAVVFPTSILVSSGDGGSVETRAVTAGDSSALLYQVDAVDRIAGVARTRANSATWVRRQLARVKTLPPPFTRVQRIGAYALLSAALSVLLGSSWPGVLLAGALGIGVGALLLATERLEAAYQALIVVAASLGVASAVLAVAHLFDAGVLPAIVAPLIMLLPGGLLTIGVIELATGHIISGGARLAAGGMRLILLATGIVGAAALLGVPPLTTTQWPIGPVAPWVAVAAFGVGIGIYQCAKPSSIGWILIVLYVAYGAQVIGDVLFDGVLSALVGAAAMTPVAVVVARQRTGPPALVSFLPAFWLLVPGALGLIGVANALEGDSSGTSAIITTIATMVSIALGVLLGLVASGSTRGFRSAPLADWMREDTDELK